MDIKEIMKLLPHRYPFLLVDKVLEIDVHAQEIVAQKNVTMNEEFFQGHFPEAPIMPGVLILEALAQAAGILIGKIGIEKGWQKRKALFLSINGAKFRLPVQPGDVLKLQAKGIIISNKSGKLQTKAMLGDKIAVEAELGFVMINEEK